MGRDTLELFARCAAGFEDVLAGELRGLRMGRVRPQVGGVSCTGRLVDAYRACLWSRVATRIQLVVGRVGAASAEDLYQGVHALPWEDHVRPGATIAVDAHGANDELRNTAFVALKVKDAVCDRLREVRGSRPDVDAKDPDLSINVAIHPKKATIYISLSGASLHRRGYRADGIQSAAPLKETLAAGMLLAAGWRDMAKEGAAFVDPMCGSGTLAIEAAMIAADVAPGLTRKRWGFEGWLGHDEALWEKVVASAHERAEGATPTLPILASDIDGDVLQIARDNARRAGVDALIGFRKADAAQLGHSLKGVLKRGVTTGLVATNPPYEERLKTVGGLPGVREALVAATDAVPVGWKVALISPDAGLDTCLGRVPETTIACYNGPIEVSVRVYEITASGPMALDLVSLDGRQHKVRVAATSSGQFAARLRKVARERMRWARRDQVSSLRLYDADLPDFALTVDCYEGLRDGETARLAVIEEYPRHGSIDAARAAQRLEDAAAIVSAVLEVEPADVLVRPWVAGSKKSGRPKRGHQVIEVEESRLRYAIDLDARPDTGLPLAERALRNYVLVHAKGKRVLVLGGLATAAAVPAVAGGAMRVVCVEPFSDRIDFVRRTLQRNDLATRRVRLVEQDLLSWLDGRQRETFDLIVLAPPARIAGKGQGQAAFELTRDHASVIARALACVSASGSLVFFVRERGFKVDAAALTALGHEVHDISAELTDRDFERSRVGCVGLLVRP